MRIALRALDNLFAKSCWLWMLHEHRRKRREETWLVWI